MAECHTTYVELLKYLTHPDRNTEVLRDERFELVKQVTPYVDAVAAAREAGLTVKVNEDPGWLEIGG